METRVHGTFHKDQLHPATEEDSAPRNGMAMSEAARIPKAIPPVRNGRLKECRNAGRYIASAFRINQLFLRTLLRKCVPGAGRHQGKGNDQRGQQGKEHVVAIVVDSFLFRSA